MPVTTGNPYAQYNQNKILTASPAELTLMLYDGAIKFLNIALGAIEEKDIPKEILLEAIETALVAAVKKQYKKNDLVQVKIDPETGDIKVLSGYEVVEAVEDESLATMQITPEEAAVRFPGKKLSVGDVAYTEVIPRDF